MTKQPVSQAEISGHDMASQRAFDKFAGVNGFPPPVDELYIQADREIMLGDDHATASLKRGAVVVMHALENSMNPNSIRSLPYYKQRQMVEFHAAERRKDKL